MSRREIIGMTTDAEWAIWRASQAVTLRDSCMRDAEIYRRTGSLEAMRTVVKLARDCNRDYLKFVAEYRALQVPQRKRA